MMYSSYFINFLCVLTKVENILGVRPYLFKKVKIYILKQLIDKDPHFTNNEINNILCIKANSNGIFCGSLKKIADKPLYDIFRASPRAIVSCVLNDNIEILLHLQSRGYPLEMIIYANNYGLVQKRKRMDILQELALDV